MIQMICRTLIRNVVNVRIDGARVIICGFLIFQACKYNQMVRNLNGFGGVAVHLRHVVRFIKKLRKFVVKN